MAETIRTIPRFWKALDDLPTAASDARDWRMRLGEEFEAISRYLRRTGEIATSVDCSSPGGDRCPMTVVHSPDGSLRAVCGCSPGVCDSIELSHEDLAILKLDYSILVGDLATAMGATSTVLAPANRRVFELGRYAVAAGLSAPVVLALPGPRDPVTEEELRLAGLGPNRAIILAPCRGSFPPEVRTRLTQAGHLPLDLSEVTGLHAGGHLELLQSVELLLDPIRGDLLARLKPTSGGPIFALPRGTQWDQVTLTLRWKRRGTGHQTQRPVQWCGDRRGDRRHRCHSRRATNLP